MRMFCAISFQRLSCWQLWVHCSGSVINTGVSPDLKLQLSQEVFGSFSRSRRCSVQKVLLDVAQEVKVWTFFFRTNYCRHITGNHSARICRRLTGASSAQSIHEFVPVQKVVLHVEI